MDENIKNLSNEDLLELYNKVLEHINYLGQNIIEIEEDGGEEDE